MRANFGGGESGRRENLGEFDGELTGEGGRERRGVWKGDGIVTIGSDRTDRGGELERWEEGNEFTVGKNGETKRIDGI